MKYQILLLSVLISSIGFSQEPKQLYNSDFSSSFFEIGFGNRTINELPTDLFVKYDTDFENVDFGDGSLLVGSFGGVVLPASHGLAYKVTFEGYLGDIGGFGMNIGGGYKLGNEWFSFTPMTEFKFGRLHTAVGKINPGAGVVYANNFDPQSSALYIGPDHSRNTNLTRELAYSLSTFYLNVSFGSYLSFKFKNNLSIFTRLAYNVHLVSGDANIDVVGQGFDSQRDFDDPNIQPHKIKTRIKTEDFMMQGGEIVKKMPLNSSGLQIQVGIGIPLG